jgi:hypothetical protein
MVIRTNRNDEPQSIALPRKTLRYLSESGISDELGGGGSRTAPKEHLSASRQIFKNSFLRYIQSSASQ